MAESFKQKHSKLIHTGFEIGLVIKGIDGFLEILGGLLLIYLSPERLSSFINFITQGELKEDPQDFIANTLIKLGAGFSISEQVFFIFYLMSHGILKCLIIYLLWRKKLWAYPLSVTVFVLFIFYQIYKYMITPSIWMFLLTIFDLLMILLTRLEYQRVKSDRKTSLNSRIK